MTDRRDDVVPRTPTIGSQVLEILTTTLQRREPYVVENARQAMQKDLDARTLGILRTILAILAKNIDTVLEDLNADTEDKRAYQAKLLAEIKNRSEE